MSRIDACLDDAVVFDFVDGRLDDEASRAVERHLQNCADCGAIVAELARFKFQSQPPSQTAGQSLNEDPAPLPPGTLVSRYVVGAVIGLGGGGVVQEAYDPQLRRKVALKLLRPMAREGISAEEVQQRLLREAQAMAQLAHPNVVYVFDAGIFRGRVFIVMELVDGETLSDLLAGRPRQPAEILEVFIAAGRGLAAAHAQGIVHGDFKPQNVLVGSQARARVTDFGLARPERQDASTLDLSGGTPAFMAPEQRHGQLDARSDQFSFCVALFMALYGRHPSETSTQPPQDRVHPSIVRGLAPDPEHRHPSMEALLDELAPAARKKRFAAAVWIAPVLILLGVFGWRQFSGARCGNGVVEAAEECDDENGRQDDACLSSCRWASCGDGHLRVGVEDCDDGNNGNDDGCSNSCLRCGEGAAAFVWPQNGHCYSRHDEPADWTSARKRCIGAGADLASYSNAAESTAVAERLLTLGSAGHWIGLSRLPTTNEYTWIGGDPWPENLKLWWATTRTAPGDDCVYEIRERDVRIKGLVRPSQWPTAPCTEPRGFLCERTAWQVFPRNHHGYRVDHRLASWPQAQRRCEKLGGHLVTINDDDEQHFVAALSNGGAWIGATDEADEGNYRWVSGERFTYAAFAPGEPDQKTRSNCLVLDVDDRWHDRHCEDVSHTAICEID